MTVAHRLARTPRPFDPDRGEEGRALFAGLERDLGDLVAAAAGSSPYLLGLMHREGDWLRAAFEAPEEALDAVLRETEAPDLRMAKRRVALLAGLMDLGGIWDLETVTAALTEFADRACALALEAALLPLLRRGKIPGLGPEAAADGGGMVVLAMGKMGAHELNYSSDIDLICLFDQDRFAPEDQYEARSGFVRATRAMARDLSDVTAEGYVFRTDLRLRPDPSVTPVCMAMEAAEQYYESLGRAWERAAYIKARPVAGDLAAGARFLEALRPFVWRKHLDFTAIEDAHNMRLAIREHKGLGGKTSLAGHDIKLGRGGIREIEFYTQTRQLIAGGRDTALRVRGTVEGLARLSAAGWVPHETAEALIGHYRFHRMIEHRVQMVQDARTHALPRTETEFERLACLMGQDRAALEAELRARLEQVHGATEGFFARRPGQGSAPSIVDQQVMARWLTFPALRSERARRLLDRLRPQFETRLARAGRPDEALLALEGFLSRLPAGVQLLSLFEANPSLIDLVLDVVATSPALADYLSHNARVLDAVIGGEFFADWPGQAGLEASLRRMLQARAGDYEATLDAARLWQKEWHFRIGVHMLRGLATAEEAGRCYADLARTVLEVLWPEVQRDFARKHGAAPGRGAVLLGMGALGAGRMNARSDLDLILIYDAGGAEGSDGPRPLATRPYFARLTQAMITAISAPMAEGRLYEVDMRLRPSGNQGPVATSWQSFRDYQTSDAWTWEHLALTRAAVVAGPALLAADVTGFLAELLSRKRDRVALVRDVASMRARIAAAKPPAGWLDVKAGPGQMQDIELLAQTGTLLSGGADRQGLPTLAQMGALDEPERLCALHATMWRVQLAGRLLAAELGEADDLGRSGTDFLLRATGASDLEALRGFLARERSWAAEVIGASLERIGREKG